MTRITISFKETEKDLLRYLQEQRSASIYIKDLIAKDMGKTTKGKKEIKKETDESDFIW